MENKKNRIEDEIQKQKRLVGERAVEFIKDGMIVGLGTGSTVFYTITKVGEMIRDGLKIQAVSTSSSTTRLAQSLGIPLISLDEVDQIDLTIDGADEVDPQLNGIKGGGGALLFEKIVASHSKENIWVIDSHKYVNKLGAFRLPVEVIPFGLRPIEQKLKNRQLEYKLRRKENGTYHTDSGNVILDINILEVTDYTELNDWLLHLPGVVETGLFLNVVDKVIMPDGRNTRILSRITK